jgi:hypothetical protein
VIVRPWPHSCGFIQWALTEFAALHESQSDPIRKSRQSEFRHPLTAFFRATRRNDPSVCHQRPSVVVPLVGSLVLLLVVAGDPAPPPKRLGLVSADGVVVVVVVKPGLPCCRPPAAPAEIGFLIPTPPLGGGVPPGGRAAFFLATLQPAESPSALQPPLHCAPA